MRIGGAYCYFCDDNNLPRIYATKTQKVENLIALAAACVAEIDRLKGNLRVGFDYPEVAA